MKKDAVGGGVVFAGALVVALLAVVAVCPAPASACGKWVLSSAKAPVADSAVRAAWGSYPNPVEGYFCACRNTTGSLLNADDGFGAGWKCWVRSGTSNVFCKVGEYYTLRSSFPSYNDPKMTNTTSTRPVPSDSIPAPNTHDDAYSCVQLATGLEGVSGVIPGSLSVDPNTGAYVCQSVYVSYKTYMTTVFIEANAGSYAAITGDVCKI